VPWTCAGGETQVNNCQILQSRVNRFKSNRSDLAGNDLKQFSCDLKFSGESPFQNVNMYCNLSLYWSGSCLPLVCLKLASIQKVAHYIKQGSMLHLYLSGVWLGVDLRTDTKKASCVSKILDY
jgi:hypothetical protein